MTPHTCQGSCYCLHFTDKEIELQKEQKERKKERKIKVTVASK